LTAIQILVNQIDRETAEKEERSAPMGRARQRCCLNRLLIDSPVARMKYVAAGCRIKSFKSIDCSM